MKDFYLFSMWFGIAFGILMLGAAIHAARGGTIPYHGALILGVGSFLSAYHAYRQQKK